MIPLRTRTSFSNIEQNPSLIFRTSPSPSQKFSIGMGTTSLHPYPLPRPTIFLTFYVFPCLQFSEFKPNFPRTSKNFLTTEKHVTIAKSTCQISPRQSGQWRTGTRERGKCKVNVERSSSSMLMLNARDLGRIRVSLIFYRFTYSTTTLSLYISIYIIASQLYYCRDTLTATSKKMNKSRSRCSQS